MQTITDGGGLSVIDSVMISIVPTLTTITVSPDSPTMDCGDTQQFSAEGFDQFGNLMDPQPSFSWGASAGSMGYEGPVRRPVGRNPNLGLRVQR